MLRRSRASAYIRNRIIFLAVVLLLASALAFTFFPQETPTIRRVPATVIEVNRGEGRSFRSGGSVVMTTVRVRVSEQVETRVMITRQAPEPGEVMDLSEHRYPDGSVRYSYSDEDM